MGSRSSRIAVLATLTLAACGGSSPSGTDAGGTDAFMASAVDANNGAFVSLAPCAAATDYVQDTTGANVVTFGASFAYTPRCIHIPTGDQVTFTGDFAIHPLHASTRGTAGNPIPATSTSTSASVLVAFPSAGFYPYYCAVHGADNGVGMAGVVWVED